MERLTHALKATTTDLPFCNFSFSFGIFYDLGTAFYVSFEDR